MGFELMQGYYFGRPGDARLHRIDQPDSRLGQPG